MDLNRSSQPSLNKLKQERIRRTPRLETTCDKKKSWTSMIKPQQSSETMRLAIACLRALNPVARPPRPSARRSTFPSTPYPRERKTCETRSWRSACRAKRDNRYRYRGNMRWHRRAFPGMPRPRLFICDASPAQRRLKELFYRAFSSIRGRRSGRTQTLVDRSLTGGP